MASRPTLYLLAAILGWPAAITFGAASLPLAAAHQRAFGGIQPDLAPDEQSIALSYQGAIGRIPIGGGPLTILTADEGWDVHPVWSPDGATLAYINTPNFLFGQLRVIRATDGARVTLKKDVRAQGRLWFHRDGRRLLGRFSASGLPERASWLDLESGALQPVEGMPNSYAARLRGVFALSHNSRWIVYAEHTDEQGQQQGDNGPQADLWRIPAEGGMPERIAWFPARVYDLCWDPRDEGLYLVTDLGAAHNDVWHVPLADPLHGAKQITTDFADDDAPTVAPDGATLVYTENSGGVTSLVRHDIATGARRGAPLASIDFRAPTGTIRLRLSDRSRQGPVVARLSLKRQDGKFHAPPGTAYHITAGLGHFYCRDSATLSLPAGEYEIRGFRGPEYRMHHAAITVRAGQDTTVDIPLERWTDAAATGWYSGENHIHANYGYGQWYNTPLSIADFAAGEDLRVSNLVVANSDGEAVFDREFFRGQADSLTNPENILYWNQEFRSTMWGHMTLIDLKRLLEPIFTGFRGTTNPWDVPTNADMAQRTRTQRGSVSYTHPTGTPEDFYLHPYSAKGLPVDAALGRIDTMDVMGWSYEPSTPFWYRLLNCGIILPAAAGTDCFLNRVTASLPGWGRAYVNLPDGLSYDRWVAGLKAGRSFVTNGPMIELTVQGRPIGDTLTMAGPGSVRVKGRAQAQFPLQKLEVIHNGVVVAEGELAADGLSARIDQEIPLQTGGWIALRTSGPAQRYWQGSSHAAHTNPVYVEMKDRRPDAADDARYFLAWIDRLEGDLKRRNRMDTETEHVQRQLDEARQYYRGLLDRR